MSDPLVFISAHELAMMEIELKRHREARYQVELNEEMLRAAKENGSIMEREKCADAVVNSGWHNDECPCAHGHPGYACECELKKIADGIRARGA